MHIQSRIIYYTVGYDTIHIFSLSGMPSSQEEHESACPGQSWGKITAGRENDVVRKKKSDKWIETMLETRTNPLLVGLQKC